MNDNQADSVPEAAIASQIVFLSHRPALSLSQNEVFHSVMFPGDDKRHHCLMALVNLIF